MKLIWLALATLVAFQYASSEEVSSLDLESLDLELVQEGVGSLIKNAGKAQTMSAADLKARNMVMLGDVATNRAKVEMAQRQLKHVLEHIGRKHPEYIVQTEAMEDFVSNDLLGESNSNKKLEECQRTISQLEDDIAEKQQEL